MIIKFFRQIRIRMLSENRLSKYILYAIGEIVLVKPVKSLPDRLDSTRCVCKLGNVRLEPCLILLAGSLGCSDHCGCFHGQTQSQSFPVGLFPVGWIGWSSWKTS